MKRGWQSLAGALVFVIAACAGGPAPEPAHVSVPAAAAPPPAPPRDYLVELGDAEASGDLVAAGIIAATYLADPDRGDAQSRLDVAEFLAAHDAPAAALSEYARQAEALAAVDPVDFAALTDIKARMAELALAAGDPAMAAQYTGEAARLVRAHLGADHPRLAPLLASAKDSGLDIDAVAAAAGITAAGDDLDTVLADSVDRERQAEKVRPDFVRGVMIVDNPDFDLVKVFYGTNRAPKSKRRVMVDGAPVLDPRVYYGADRAPLETGTVMVSVPRNRAVGDIPKSSLFRFEFRPDPSKHVIMSGMKIHPGMDDFVREMKLELARSSRREIFVFIHGYNNDFATAVERTAQLSVDLEIDGAAVLYSWPSFGTVFSYRGDRAQITGPTIKDLENFLTVLAEDTGADRVHVIAHSMGNEFLTRALAGLAETPRETPMFDQVVFASPDVDADDFVEMVSKLGSLANDMTLYASSRDKALQASRRFNRTGRRAGESDDPVLLAGLNTIDTTQGSSGGLGHSDIFDSAFTDFQAVLWLSLEPEKRCLLGKKSVHNAIAWVFGTPRETFCGQEEFATAITTLRRIGPDRTVEVLANKANGPDSKNDPSALLWSSALKIVQAMQ